jgi:uncharacterized membrane protein
MQDTTDLFGVPVPSTDPVFLAFVVLHVVLGVSAVVIGICAMLSRKTGERHRKFGVYYFGLMAASFVTIIVLSVMRWPHNVHLLAIGVLAFGSAYAGRKLIKASTKRWSRWHTALMGISYVMLLTGFYVDNGKNLPFWNLFPQWFFYLFPSMIGIPIIVRVLKTHPLNRTR